MIYASVTKITVHSAPQEFAAKSKTTGQESNAGGATSTCLSIEPFVETARGAVMALRQHVGMETQLSSANEGWTGKGESSAAISCKQLREGGGRTEEPRK